MYANRGTLLKGEQNKRDQADKRVEQLKRITKKDVAGYVLLPRIIPRTREFFTSGFSMISYMIAIMYGMVKLLPADHPYLNPNNRGQYSIRDVIAQAANRLVLKKENFDQIIIFVAILVGVILLCLQFFAIIYSILIGPATAQIFNTMEPDKDVAFILMDRVFGVPDLFCNAQGACSEIQGQLPFPFHTALHKLFQFYSLGMLVIGVVIFLYYIVIVVGETAISGTPFGQRFANMWVPIRLIAALGLLVPINNGLNSAQYITLTAAKYGSGLATNGWIQFNKAVSGEEKGEGNFPNDQRGGSTDTPAGEKESLLAHPIAPDFTPVVEFMTIVHACAYSYWIQNQEGDEPPEGDIKAYFVKQPDARQKNKEEKAEADSYANGLEFYNQGDIVIRFGKEITGDNNYKGSIRPICGEIRIHSAGVDNKGKGGDQGGPDAIQQGYFDLALNMWKDGTDYKDLAKDYIDYATNRGTGDDDKKSPPSTEIRQQLIVKANGSVKAKVKEAWEKYRKVALFDYTDKMKARGWGGAGIWYNQIARTNGTFMGATQKIPSIGQDGMPEIMNKIRKIVESENNAPDINDMYCPNIKMQTAINEAVGNDMETAKNLCSFMRYWHADAPNQGDSEDELRGNAFVDAMHLIFGTQGLFDIRKTNGDVHPLAQLAGIGKSLVDSAIFNIGASTGLAFGGGMLQTMGYNKTGAALQMAGSAMSSIAFIGLTAGFLLYYILPFMPFLYFFFAVGTWIKSIFEAMVGVPLWALAHLRLDGNGLPGEAAANGYYLILEILIRPIMIVFGLVAALVIFTAQARGLNFVWDLVLNNLTGFERVGGQSNGTVDFVGVNLKRGIVDEFFFTIIYVMVLYMMANASFKLIDKIPQNIIRWIGSSASSFGDFDGSANIEQINKYVAISGATIGQEVTTAVNTGAKGLGRSVGGALRTLGK